MSETHADCFGTDFWAGLMGRDLPDAEWQPFHPVRIENGRLRFAVGAHRRIPDDANVAAALRDGRIVLTQSPDSSAAAEQRIRDWERVIDVELPPALRERLPAGEPLIAMLVDGPEDLELVPIRVVEHEPDLLGPRILDEFHPAESLTQGIVRHVVTGPQYEQWTTERLGELERLLCATPFRCDPLQETAAGDDWVGCKTRREVLGRPAAGDAALQASLVESVFADQQDGGSWGDGVLETAYGVLRALALGVPAEDARLQRAARWLLARPEPANRPGMWLLTDELVHLWDANVRGEQPCKERSFFPEDPGEQNALVRGEACQRVLPTCARHFAGLCDWILHPSATAVEALCRCGHGDHPRVRNYATAIQKVRGPFGYFCACWGINDLDTPIEDPGGAEPDLNQHPDEREIALRSIPYGYGRDPEDLKLLARHPCLPGVHRPDLADTNGWVPYRWKQIGAANHFAVVGSYWQNADCWAKTNRALSQLGAWPGSEAEFLALFQCHLYQTSLGAWDQGFPFALLRWIERVSRATRTRPGGGDAPAGRSARLLVLRTIPWLREHQEDSGLWDHQSLSRWRDGASRPPPGPRLVTYHIVSVLREFNLLDRLRPTR
jgi:hypothetical protein